MLNTHVQTNSVKLAAIALLMLLSACATTPHETVENPPQAATKIARQTINFLFQSNRLAVLEPCSCDSNPYGGIDREANAISQIRGKNSYVFYVDAGNLLAPEEISPKNLVHFEGKAVDLVNALNKMSLDVFAPGPKDYALGSAFLQSLAKQARFKFVTSNVKTEAGKPLFEPYVILSKGGLNYAFLSLTPPEQVKDKTLRVTDPDAALKEWVPVVAPKSDFIVVLSQLPLAENEKLIAKHRDHLPLFIGADPMVSTDDGYWFGGHTLLVDPVNYGHRLGHLRLDLKLPFKGLYSPQAVQQNLEQVRQLEERIVAEPQNTFPRTMLSRIKRTKQLAPIDGGTVYQQELITLDAERFGRKNSITELIQKHKDKTRERSLSE